MLGPSGCGKSTTLFMLAGIYAAERRRHPVRRRAGQRGRGARPQRRHRLPVLRALSAHDRAREHRCSRCASRTSNGARPSAARARSPRWCRSTSCSTGGRASCPAASSSASRSPARWSRSRSCCCSTSRCRISTPSLRLTMRSEIRRLQRELGVTTILVTHDQIEATTMADRVVCMNTRPDRAGRHRRRSLPAARTACSSPSFIGSPPINLFDGHADGRRAQGSRRRASR